MNNLRHPCAETCSGYRQGMEDGARAERERLEQESASLISTWNEREKGLVAENTRLRAALEEAEEAIHGEYCSTQHHPYCDTVRKALGRD